MDTQRKQLIEKAFAQTLRLLSEAFSIPVNHLTLRAYIENRNKMRLYLCRKERIVRELDAGQLLSAKLIALGLDSEALKNLFLSTHHAFMGEMLVDKRERLSLLIYDSQKVGCTCLGILLDENPQKALKISDVLEAIGMGEEHLN